MINRLNSLLELHEKDPSDSFVTYGIALEYISSGNYEKAEEFLSLLIKNDPEYVPAYMQFAMLKEKMDEIDQAKKIYRRGIVVAKETQDLKAAKEMEEFLNDLE